MCETHGHLEHHVGRLIVTDRFKHIANRGQMDELYDLWDDLYEMTNLVDDPAYAEVLTDLQIRLSSWQSKTHDHQTRCQSTGIKENELTTAQRQGR